MMLFAPGALLYCESMVDVPATHKGHGKMYHIASGSVYEPAAMYLV